MPINKQRNIIKVSKTLNFFRLYHGENYKRKNEFFFSRKDNMIRLFHLRGMAYENTTECLAEEKNCISILFEKP